MRFFLLIAFFLAGCVSAEKAERMEFAALGKRCEKLGVKKDTEEYRNCVLKLHQINQLTGQHETGMIDWLRGKD